MVPYSSPAQPSRLRHLSSSENGIFQAKAHPSPWSLILWVACGGGGGGGTAVKPGPQGLLLAVASQGLAWGQDEEKQPLLDWEPEEVKWL